MSGYGHDEAMRSLNILQGGWQPLAGGEGELAATEIAAYIERLERKAAKAGILLSPDSGFDLMDERDEWKAIAQVLASDRACDYYEGEWHSCDGRDCDVEEAARPIRDECVRKTVDERIANAREKVAK